MTDRRTPAADGEAAARANVRRAALEAGVRARVVRAPLPGEIDLRGLEVEILGRGGMVGEFDVRVLDVTALEARGRAAGVDVSADWIGVEESDYRRGDFGWEMDGADLEAIARWRCPDCGTGDPRDHSMACNAPAPAPSIDEDAGPLHSWDDDAAAPEEKRR